MKKIALISLVITVAAVLLIIFLPERSSGPMVPVESEFPDKIVYGTSGDLDADELKKDCDARGGTFNSCGSVCPSDAEVCIQVCAYTCEFKK